MPVASNTGLLDFVSGGYPFMRALTSGVDGGGLDIVEGGSPTYMSSGEVSTSIMRATQVVAEVLRDADDPAGGNLRATQVATEVLIENNETIYVTAIVKERMWRNTAGDVAGAVGKSWMVFDEVNHLDVTFQYGTAPTSAADDLAVLNGANMALWGDELIQFRDVTPLGGNLYRLSRLLRGRFGTEVYMNTHLVGDRFIMVSIDTWRRVAQAEGDLGTSKLYKGVTVGMTLAQAQTRAFTNYGKGLVPYAPCFVTGARDGGNNLTISWYRRSRYNAEWRDASEIPIGEDTEAYEVDILDSVGNVLRVLSSTTTSVVYSAADQTTDFGSPASLISIIVYQMSAIIGRGYGTRIAV